jgi:hypothetical protein
MFFIDPAIGHRADDVRKGFAHAIERQGTHVERADGPDGDGTMPTTLLHIILDQDATIAGPGYGQLGADDGRCLELQKLVDRALADLAAR